MNLFESPGRNSAENICRNLICKNLGKYNAQHAQKLDQETAARTSRELGNSLTKSYADFYADVLMIFFTK